MNNSFFTLCGPYSTNKNDLYNCCINSCKSQSTAPHMCFATCAQVFPMIKDRCAFEQECWRDGFFNKKCIEAKSKEIQECCVEKCQSNTRLNRFTPNVLDCDRYCSEYQLQ